MVDQDFTIQENNVVVTGGRPSVKVDTSFGPAGTRGGLILYGAGKPTDPDVVFTFTPRLLDWYINLNVTDDEYLFLYQYVSSPDFEGGIGWSRIFKIIPNTYSTNVDVFFGAVIDGEAIAGRARALINITNTSISLLGISGLNELNTHIDIETDLSLPVASSFKVLPPIIDLATQQYVIPIDIVAAQLHPLTGWEPVGNEAIAHITINVV
jgi:hypothetical protein